MNCNILIQSNSQISDTEVAERKGIGHPDTICDCIADEISSALSEYYIAEFGSILYHNVDNVLLVGGNSKPMYNGGTILKPIEIILAGSATHEVKGKIIPVSEIAVQAAKKWLKNNLRFVDIKDNIQITPKFRQGSSDLTELFQRFSNGESPLAKDTSIGVGYYPFSLLEKSVLDIEHLLNSKPVKQILPFTGEDIKVTGINSKNGISYTIAVAMIDRFVFDIEEYRNIITLIKNFIAVQFNLCQQFIEINTADNYQSESIYLTVSGISAEAGYYGEVGRGNRINGLITPCRPMSLEAVAGKNPISHIGKLYNHFAFDLSKVICENHFAEEAQIYIISQIGKPITQPQLLNIKLKNQNVNNTQIEKLVKDKLSEITQLGKQQLNYVKPFELYNH